MLFSSDLPPPKLLQSPPGGVPVPRALQEALTGAASHGIDLGFPVNLALVIQGDKTRTAARVHPLFSFLQVVLGQVTECLSILVSLFVLKCFETWGEKSLFLKHWLVFQVFVNVLKQV